MELSHGILGPWIKSIQAGEAKLGTPQAAAGYCHQERQGDYAVQRADREETWPSQSCPCAQSRPWLCRCGSAVDCGPSSLSSEYCTSLNADKAVGSSKGCGLLKLVTVNRTRRSRLSCLPVHHTTLLITLLARMLLVAGIKTTNHSSSGWEGNFLLHHCCGQGERWPQAC